MEPLGVRRQLCMFLTGNRQELTPIHGATGGTNPELVPGVRGDGPAMMTNAATTDCLRQHAALTPATTAQKVVIVNGTAEILDLLETVLDAGHYDVVFVESSHHAYSQIKRVQPNLVILCVRIEEADGFQVLSMLKLDDETRDIPVLTYTTEYDRTESEEDVAESSDTSMFATTPAVWMN
jgi:CheY-like chemotaxis protein